MTVLDGKKLSPLQTERVIETLTSAFDDYSLMRHFLAEGDYSNRLRSFQEAFLRDVGLAAGHVWTAGDGAAVSIWTAPDIEDAAAVFIPFAAKLAAIAGSRAEIMQASEAVMAKERPQFPCWFLGSVAVDPASQGKGLGRAVIEPGLEMAEKQGYPVFLETSDEANVRIYERLGFEVKAAYPLPFNGPETYAMIKGVRNEL